MSIKIKTSDEIEKMRVAGKLAADVLEMIELHIKSGITTDELDSICYKYITETQKAIPAPLNYHGFPKSICTSINHIVCHGIPASVDEMGSTGKVKPAVLKEGDILNVDITVIKDGYHGDTSKMFLIGDVSLENKRLCMVAQESLYVGMKVVKPNVTLSDIGAAIQKYIKGATPKFSIVRDFCGHGIGDEFHEEPQILHYKNNFDNRALKAGMCFTIEPMINVGKFSCSVDKKDGWTVYTEDGKNSAQWEHTLLVTETGCEVLTLRSDEKIPRFMNNTKN